MKNIFPHAGHVLTTFTVLALSLLNLSCNDKGDTKSTADFFETCTYLYDDVLTDYGIDEDHVIMVSTTDGGDYTTIQSALDARTTYYDSGLTVIYLADTSFNESIVIDQTAQSNTAIVGCGENSSIDADTSSITTTTHAVEVGINAENIQFDNLTIRGIGGASTPSVSDASEYSETATVYFNNAKDFKLKNVTVDNSYYRAILVSGSAAWGSITDSVIGDTFAGDSAVGMDFSMGIKVQSNTADTTTISNLTFTGAPDFGIYGKNTALSLSNTDVDVSVATALVLQQDDSSNIATSNNSIENGSYTGVIFSTVTVNGSGANLTNCNYYSSDVGGYSSQCSECSSSLCE